MTAIEEMLSRYSLDNEDQYKQAFKEIMQEVVLCGLARSGFFDVAAFTGGTALRILHGIRRFSEDLVTITDDKIQFLDKCVACLGCYHRCPKKAIIYKGRHI